MKAMRGHVGEIVFFFNEDGSIGYVDGWCLDLYREWVKTNEPLKLGEWRELV